MSIRFRDISVLTIGIIILSAGSWMYLGQNMTMMDQGPATKAGSLIEFLSMWMLMINAMMLPGIFLHLKIMRSYNNSLHDRLMFMLQYLLVWLVAGCFTYLVYKPHTIFLAGLITTAAGLYELTRMKSKFRVYDRQNHHNGLLCGLYCLGSCGLLMAMQVAIGIMSLKWMIIISVIILLQKFLPPRPLLDSGIAFCIISIGLCLMLNPSLLDHNLKLFSV